MIKSRIYSWQTSPNITQQKFRFAPNSTPTRTQTWNWPKQASKPDHSIPQTHNRTSLTYRSTLGFSSPHRPHARPKPGSKNSFTTLPRHLLMGYHHIEQLLPRLVCRKHSEGKPGPATAFRVAFLYQHSVETMRMQRSDHRHSLFFLQAFLVS